MRNETDHWHALAATTAASTLALVIRRGRTHASDQILQGRCQSLRLVTVPVGGAQKIVPKVVEHPQTRAAGWNCQCERSVRTDRLSGRFSPGLSVLRPCP